MVVDEVRFYAILTPFLMIWSVNSAALLGKAVWMAVIILSAVLRQVVRRVHDELCLRRNVDGRFGSFDLLLNMFFHEKTVIAAGRSRGAGEGM